MRLGRPPKSGMRVAGGVEGEVMAVVFMRSSFTLQHKAEVKFSYAWFGRLWPNLGRVIEARPDHALFFIESGLI